MDCWEIDPRFDTSDNAEVLGFLRRARPSAHSDVAEELLRSANRLAGVTHYCPDPVNHAFVALHLANFSILGLAYGQSKLAYRLPENRIEQAIQEGALQASELGRGWLFFEPWSIKPLQESRRRLAQWCAIAVAGAQDTADSLHSPPT